MAIEIREHPLLMPSLRGTVSCTGCGRIIGRGEGQSFYLFEDGKPKGPAMCYACKRTDEVIDKLEGVAVENEDLREGGWEIVRALEALRMSVRDERDARDVSAIADRLHEILLANAPPPSEAGSEVTNA